MVSMEIAPHSFRRPTPHAPIAVSFVDLLDYFFPFFGGIKTLPFWRTTVNIVRIAFSVLTTHPISFSSQVRLRNRRFFTQDTARFFRVLVSRKRIFIWMHTHIVVRFAKVMPTWTSWYSKIHQLFINTFRVTTNYLSYVVRRKLLNYILLVQPFPVKVKRFAHALNFNPKYGGTQAATNHADLPLFSTI